jgi:16S rRNA (guanine527-N7)-methyltransferase
MTEAEAQQALDVPRETLQAIRRFADLLTAENARQNLVSAASLCHLWERHILDSAQLLEHVPPSAASWLDIGSGAGFPGLITATIFPGRTTLVEPRKLRVEFLRRGAEVLRVEERVNIICGRVEAVPGAPYDVISARAFASLDKIFAATTRFAADETRWVLPKGRNAKSELEAAESLWQGEFRVEPSRTDAEAGIVVAERVRPKSRGRRGR